MTRESRSTYRDVLTKKASRLLLEDFPYNYASERVTKPTKICRTSRPCRDVHCNRCMEIREEYFSTEGGVYIREHHLDCFWTLKIPYRSTISPWEALLNESPRLWRQAYRKRPGKFVRCLALGNLCNTPHVHLIVTKHGSQILTHIAEKNYSAKPVIESVTSPENLLAYLFRQNYLPTVQRYDRPKRVRLLSASKGLRVGFPPTNHSKVDHFCRVK